jgi:RND superfamily putative drug exporter
MFERLGNFAYHRKWWIILGWIALAVIVTLIAPPLEDISSSDQRDFMPADAPFAKAQAVYEQTFPNLFDPSSTMLLIDAGEGGTVRAPAIWAYMEKAEAWLNSDDAPDNIGNVAAPTTDPDYADALISPDGQIALISVSLSTATDSAVTTETVNAIDNWVAANEPDGFTVYQTGEAALNAQGEESTFTTMDRTLVITFALVIVALLWIYRSPISPLIPLFSVTIAFVTTIGLAAILAELDVITVILQVEPLLIVVMYGAGTDYCLFLISRFREEMADDIGIEQATKRTVHMVGETISSSAATIFVGFMSMTFAEIGMVRSAGPMLALGIATSLLAGLTLTPALLATMGNRAFWPFKASHRSTGHFYAMTSKLVSSRPLTTIVIIVVIMIPFSIHGLTQELNYDSVSELPKHIPAVEGYNLLRNHMGGGNLFPMTAVLTDRDPDTMAAEIVKLTNDLMTIPNIDDVRGLNTPLGVHNAQINNLLRVDGQLSVLLALDEGDDNAAVDPQQTLEMIGSIQGYIDLLAERFPEVADDPNLIAARDIVSGGILQIGLRQDDLMAAVQGLIDRFKTIEDAYLMPPTSDGELFAAFQPLIDNYVSADGTAYRVEIVMDDPLGPASAETVKAIRDLLTTYKGNGKAEASGFPAVMTDLRETMDRDTIRSFGFILTGIFVVLLVMLRSVVAPLYLIATVVLSFTCTLGLTQLVFSTFFDMEKLSWMLPLFMFVFLVALGIDYSIFLFGRIKEEVAHHGVREGVHVAVAATGMIITSAAVILAGTFAGMMAGEIMFLAQLGFAVSVGVLIDAFVVRTMLDPALATLFGKWTWWPGGVPHEKGSPISTASGTPTTEAEN